MTFKRLSLATVGAALIAAPAFAGSVAPAPADPVIAPAPVASPGIDWTGAYGGLSLGYADVSTSGAASLSGDGMIGGLSLGYDYDLGNIVLGAGIDYDISDIDVGGADTLESVARLKLRAGYEMGRGLLYATGGAAQASLANLGEDTGYFAGIGYEHMLTDKVSIGGEVLYHAFDDFNGSGIDVEATTAAAKVNFRF
ncbi:outer membrane protein [Thalassovita aquimarina]|uniref:Outer membrane beta-barrel protein n=1 Tax=Thalassovita aquimarina TaxID=2785917 RepID=A0ABS5HMY9_9RHOB|nr:outer membrane beta-barrel protein [Thalassovita aquimarina]MBR9650312.1 outer membrane beta-barrel protein [Thalassovita aquimarina]